MNHHGDCSAPTKLMTFHARYKSLEAISEFIRDACVAANLDETASYQVQLSVDEACSNIIGHAYGDESDDPIEIRCSVTAEGLVVELHDHGKPFDPSEVRNPDLGVPLEERRAGGLGIFLMRRYMDEVEFRTVLPGPSSESTAGTGNYLTLVKRREKA